MGIKQASLLCLGVILLSLLGALSPGKLQFCASVSPSVKWVGVAVAPPSLCCVRYLLHVKGAGVKYLRLTLGKNVDCCSQKQVTNGVRRLASGSLHQWCLPGTCKGADLSRR